MKTLTELGRRRSATKVVLGEYKEALIGIILLCVLFSPAFFVTSALIALFVFENIILTSILVVFTVIALCIINFSNSFRNWWKKSVPAYVCMTCGWKTNSLYDAHAHDPTHDMRHRCFAKQNKQNKELKEMGIIG